MGMKTRAKRCISLVILCFIPVLVRGQTGGDDPGQISGTVQATDGTKLPGVSISIKETEISTVTDDVGNYLLTDVPLGQFTIMASLPSFAEREVAVLLENQNTVTVDITLELAELQFEITVVLDTAELMNASESIGVVSVLPSQVAALPSLGEKDIFRSLQLMPGISATNEASAGLYIRGGTPDQNLVLFDGFTIYDVDHFFGIFSAFNANAIENITMYKGGFESKYGSRISSVVDLTGKSGRSNEPSFGGGISFLSYNAYMDIPLGRAEVFKFANDQTFVRIQENIRQRDVFIIQPTCAPVNDNLMELLIMIDACKRASAGRITAVVPYYG
ncbi:MAG: ribose-phosphate pyrophosphokinase-like domain-containing protein, partial [Acidobacteria bacterium]|nr:ribose-phosphate pyrophosphokinase-like domain-containing protein [Acidobacteriota bacterium]